LRKETSLISDILWINNVFNCIAVMASNMYCKDRKFKKTIYYPIVVSSKEICPDKESW